LIEGQDKTAQGLVQHVFNERNIMKKARAIIHGGACIG
jgi:hypothetical protein